MNADRGIDARSPRPAVKISSVADAAASILRAEIMNRMDGDLFLGSEETIARDLGISKPSLRQATRMLESEQLLEVRRGVGGGLFIRKPSEETVLRTVDLYMTARGTPFHDVVRACIPLRTEAVRNIALNPDPAIRRRPLEFIEAEHDNLFASSGRPFSEAMTRLVQLLADLVGNETLGLLNHLLLTYGHRYPYSEYYTPDRCVAYAETWKTAALAVAAGEPDKASDLIRTGMERLADWTEAVGSGARAR